MQRQKLLKYFMLLYVFLILDVPNLCSAKKYSSYSSQGKATTRRTYTKPNEEATKLSYGSNQNQPPPQNHVYPQPPPYSPSQQPQYPPQPPQYHQPPPPYSQQAIPQQHYPPQPAPGYQTAPQQPIIVNHVQQPQSSGGLGTAGGIALGALGGAVGGYALSEALKDGGEKKEETTTVVTSTSAVTVKKEEVQSTTAASESNDTVTLIKDPIMHLSESIVDITSTTHEIENATLSSNATEPASPTPAPMADHEVLFENKNSTETHSSLMNDATGAKFSLNIVLLTFIYNFIL